MSLYESIFTRKSSRNFLPQPLEPDVTQQIHEFMQSIKRLDSGIKVGIDILTEQEISGITHNKAPYFLALYSEEKPGYLPNAGFMLQQLDLFLSTLGLGSCYLGISKPKELKKLGLDYQIMLGFGMVAQAPLRQPHEFKRKALSEISLGEDSRLEAARLAPSAVNSQPWFFACQGGGIDLYRLKLGVIKGAMMNGMNQIDMGIALCHLYLASVHQGRTFNFTLGGEPSSQPPAGYTFFGSISADNGEVTS